MRIAIFGLTVSSSWGNGHATLWRSLIRALDERGDEIAFFERDTPYYRAHRDLAALPGRARLHIYSDWLEIEPSARAAADAADAAIVTSYCPDGRAASRLVLASRARVRVFYDLDTPVTLAQLAAGADVPYLPPGGLAAFDLVLSFTGGRALDRLRRDLGARRAETLYGSVDLDRYRPVERDAPQPLAAASYLGTWAADRHERLEALFVEPARRHPDHRFVLAGAQYPPELQWPPNVMRHEHVPPHAHAAFFCASRLTVSVTRRPMAELGHCPSGRLFEAAACGVPVLSDWFEGLDAFFAPDREILVARSTDDAVAAMRRPPEQLAAIGARARARVIAEHTGAHRAAELHALIGGVS